MESLRGMAKKKKVRSPGTCPHDIGPSYSLPATMECVSWSATNSSPLCIAFYVLPCCKPLGSVVSEHGLRSLKLRVRCTDLFLTTVTFRIVLKDFHQNWFGSDCSVTMSHWRVQRWAFPLTFIPHVYVLGGGISTGCVSLEHFTN